jgi:hypothetical protein
VEPLRKLEAGVYMIKPNVGNWQSWRRTLGDGGGYKAAKK